MYKELHPRLSDVPRLSDDMTAEHHRVLCDFMSNVGFLALDGHRLPISPQELVDHDDRNANTKFIGIDQSGNGVFVATKYIAEDEIIRLRRPIYRCLCNKCVAAPLRHPQNPRNVKSANQQQQSTSNADTVNVLHKPTQEKNEGDTRGGNQAGLQRLESDIDAITPAPPSQNAPGSPHHNKPQKVGDSQSGNQQPSNLGQSYNSGEFHEIGRSNNPEGVNNNDGAGSSGGDNEAKGKVSIFKHSIKQKVKKMLRIKENPALIVEHHEDPDTRDMAVAGGR
ncbi:hypothetical protein EsH8_VI_000503 [Colletotrichum jinshuiense]